MNSWLNLSDCIYRVAAEAFLSPPKSQHYRIDNLCKWFKKAKGNKEKMQKLQKFKDALELGDPKGPLIGYIAKMIFVPNKNINDKSSTMTQRMDTSITNGNFFAFSRLYSGSIKIGDTITLILNASDSAE
jgi:hypothetical protein